MQSPQVHLERNSEPIMDRIEQTGLITAVLIHGLLALAIWLAMQNAPREEVKPPPAISVSLVGEVAPVSTAPDAIQAEPAPASSAELEAAPLSDPAPEAPSVLPTPVPQIKPTPERQITPTPPKMAAKPKPTPKPAQKTTPPKANTKPAGKPVPQKKSGGFGKGFEEKIAGIGGSAGSNNSSASSGAGKASGTPAAKSGSEVRRDVSAKLGSQIKPYLDSCVNNSPEINRLVFPVSVSLDKNGRAASTSIGNPSGITDTNRPQIGPIKDCIAKAINAASPFRGLDPDYHDIWKSHSMRMRASS
ncbi:MAG: hypothetical protein HC843_08335 [Sphingomonadales bacterium]|nr:hypothetical protein [Sphingomonadales bacterium]